MSYYNGLKNASGRFAMMLSDEDYLAVEQLDEMLDYLSAHQNLGAVTFNEMFGKNPSDPKRETKIFEKKIERLKWAFDEIPYFSGTCFNVNYIKKAGIFEIIKEKYLDAPEFSFAEYIHIIFATLLADQYYVANSGVKGWYLGEEENIIPEMKNGIFTYTRPENRWIQEDGAMELLGSLLDGQNLEEMFHHQINRIFYQLSLVYKLYGDKLGQEYRWSDIWLAHYRNCLQIVQKLENKFENIPSMIDKMNRSFLYWQICKREQRWHTPEENLLPSLQAQVVKYYHEKGVPFDKIDFDGIEQDR